MLTSPLLILTFFISSLDASAAIPAPSASAPAKSTNAEATAPAADKWEKDIAAFEAADKKAPPPANGILFIGSSSMRMWKTLAADFPDLPVFNRGFGGSQIEDVNRYIDRIVLPYQPKTIVFYAGGNDLSAKKTPQRVLSDWQTFATQVRKALPAARLFYIAIRPSVKRAALQDIEAKTNALIRADIEARNNMHFVDTTAALSNSEGKARPELLIADGLHMNADGYAIWTKVLTPLLKQ
jgi:lysophospholipase L1-like esterase